jgi:hypothetical protein
MNKFLDTYNPLVLNSEEIQNLNRVKMGKEIESVIKCLPSKKSQKLYALLLNYAKHVKKNLTFINEQIIQTKNQ